MSPKEFFVVEKLYYGYSYKEIAFELHITYKAVYHHIRGLKSKFGVKDQQELLTYIASNIDQLRREVRKQSTEASRDVDKKILIDNLTEELYRTKAKLSIAIDALNEYNEGFDEPIAMIALDEIGQVDQRH